LTAERLAISTLYDFNPSNKLAVVLNGIKTFRDVPPYVIGVRYSLLPLKKGEFKLLSKKEARENEGFGWLNSFETFVRNGVVDLNDVPVEIIARPGEINREMLNKPDFGGGMIVRPDRPDFDLFDMDYIFGEVAR